jgi:hypothetical protein
MSSVALREWQGTRSVQLDELDAAHGAVGGTGPGRRYATRQLNHAYTVVLAAQFQGAARQLHARCLAYAQLFAALARTRPHPGLPHLPFAARLRHPDRAERYRVELQQ